MNNEESRHFVRDALQFVLGLQSTSQFMAKVRLKLLFVVCSLAWNYLLCPLVSIDNLPQLPRRSATSNTSEV